MRCSIDVDLRDRCLRSGRNDSLDANTLAAEGGRFGMNHAEEALVRAISYWAYVAFLPALFIALVVHGLIRLKD